MLATVLPQAFNGIVYGMMLALVSVGLSLTFGVMRVMNFAHGEFLMLGSYLALTVILHAGNFVVALLAAFLLVGLLGVVTERVMLRPLYGRPPMHILIATYGLSMILVESARIVWGANPLGFPTPVPGTVRWLGMSYPTYRLVLVAVAAGLIVTLWTAIHHSRFGTMIRATARSPETVAALGVNVPAVMTITFAVGAAVAGLSGVLMAPLLAVYSTVGHDVILSAFAVVIIGGLGSFHGAVAASILVGVLESVALVWVAPSLARMVTFVLMVVVLLVRPQGLFGAQAGEEA